MLSKVVKKIIFQIKTLLVMFYRYNKTFWYQFCNFKHFLKAENSEDSLASSCVEFSIGLSCNPVWDWVTVGTTHRWMNGEINKFQRHLKRGREQWLVKGQYTKRGAYLSGEELARERNIANRNRPTTNRDGERYVKELEKKASRWKKTAKLQKRMVAALVTVVRQREVANNSCPNLK